MQVFQIVQLTNRSILITIETIEIRGITKHFIDKAKAIEQEVDYILLDCNRIEDIFEHKGFNY